MGLSYVYAACFYLKTINILENKIHFKYLHVFKTFCVKQLIFMQNFLKLIEFPRKVRLSPYVYLFVAIY